MVQTLIAYDTERMVAYAFIVYLPLGMLYFARVLEDLPRPLAAGLLWMFGVLAMAEHYARVFGHVTRRMMLGMSAAELLVVGATIWLHLAVYQRPRTSGGPPG